MTMGERIVAYARKKLGCPFCHHFKPNNECDYGVRTVDGCMSSGLDDRGYDCSGMIVSVHAEVFRISIRQWPRQYRHVQQLAKLNDDTNAKPGDILTFYIEPVPGKTQRLQPEYLSVLGR